MGLNRFCDRRKQRPYRLNIDGESLSRQGPILAAHQNQLDLYSPYKPSRRSACALESYAGTGSSIPLSVSLTRRGELSD